MGFFSFFGKVKSFLGRALGFIKQYVPEQVQQAAVNYVRDAELKFVNNADRREYVVKLLMDRFKLPESVARLATEIAVGLVKKELA